MRMWAHALSVPYHPLQAVRDAAHDDTRSPVVQQVAKGAVVVGETAAAVAHAAVEQVPAGLRPAS